MNPVSRWFSLSALWWTLMLMPIDAGAEEVRDDPRARQFFEIGAQAYLKGQYLLAIDALEQAYALTERPGLMFSLAQAHQRQFRMVGDEQHLERAIDSYRKYLARVPSGGRRNDAERSLNELLATADRLHAEAQVAPGRRPFGRLLLSSSSQGASISVNGEPVESVPTSLELPADKYRIVATAEGFESHSQEIVLAAGSVVPLNFELKPLPALVRVSGTAGAEVLVDGRLVGSLPMGEVTLPAGEHWVSVLRSGYRTRSVRVRLQRGRTIQVKLALDRTFQRDLAHVVAGGAGVAGVATVTFAVIAWQRARSANEFASRLGGQISLTDAEKLNRDVAARDRFESLAISSGIASAALLGSSLLLFVLDAPSPPATAESIQTANRTRRLNLTPIVGAAWGVGVEAHF